MDLDLSRLDDLRTQFEVWRSESAGLRERIDVVQQRRDRLAARLTTLRPLRQLSRAWSRSNPGNVTGDATQEPRVLAEVPAAVDPETLAELQRDIARDDRTLEEMTARQADAFRRWQSIGRLIERCEAFVRNQRWQSAA